MFRRNLRNSFVVFAILMGLTCSRGLEVKAAPVNELAAEKDIVRIRCAEQGTENKSKSEQLREELDSVESAKEVTELELKETKIGRALTESIITSIDNELSNLREKYIELAYSKMKLIEVDNNVYKYGWSLSDISSYAVADKLSDEMRKINKVQMELRSERTRRLRDLDNIVLSEIDLEVRIDNLVCDKEDIKTEMEQAEEEALYNTNTAVAVDMYAEVDFNKIIDTNTLTHDVNGTTGLDLVNWAGQFVGNPYIYGGTDILHGIDCSAFIQQIYSHFGYSLPRTSEEQRNVGEFITSIADAQPGDIFCYPGHVAMYCGNGVLVHASNHRDGIKYSNVNYRRPLCIKRVITEDGQTAGSINNQAFDITGHSDSVGEYFSIDIVRKETNIIGQADDISLVGDNDKNESIENRTER